MVESGSCLVCLSEKEFAHIKLWWYLCLPSPARFRRCFFWTMSLCLSRETFTRASPHFPQILFLVRPINFSYVARTISFRRVGFSIHFSISTSALFCTESVVALNLVQCPGTMSSANVLWRYCFRTVDTAETSLKVSIKLGEMLVVGLHWCILDSAGLWCWHDRWLMHGTL